MSPGTCLQYGYVVAVIAHGADLPIRTEFTKSDSQIQIQHSDLAMLAVGPIQATEELSIRGVKQQVPSVDGCIPKEQPLAIGRPRHTLGIICLWSPRSLQLASGGVMDAQDVPPPYSRQQGKMAGTRMERVSSGRRSWIVPFRAANFDSLVGEQIKQEDFQAQGGKYNQLVVITAKLHIGWLP